jgi:predicted aldo/keto reductase-like oxidoreductase
MSTQSRRNFLTAQQLSQSNTPKLEFRTLGRTGLKVSALSFGCMTTSDISVIQRAADLGIVHFDTARAYQGGNNEKMVGAALKSRRKQVIISSKSLGKTREELLKDLDTSLRELGTDYLDIWYLHSRNDPTELSEDLFEAQHAAKQSGKIRFAGVSTHFNMDRMLPYLAKLGQTDVVLTTYNFAMRSVAVGDNTNRSALKSDMTTAIRKARQAGLGIVTMKALAGGTTRVQRGDRLYGANAESLTAQLKQEGAPLAAIKWVLRNRSVDTAIVCMTDQDQLDENVRAMADPYSDRDEKLLATALAHIGPIYCRMCGACRGACGKGIPVPDVLRFLNYAEGYGQFAMARARYLGLPGRVRAIRCGDCERCSIDCPNGVHVQERIARAQALLA